MNLMASMLGLLGVVFPASRTMYLDDSMVWIAVFLLATTFMFGFFCAFLLGRYQRERNQARWLALTGGMLAPRPPVFSPYPIEMTWSWLAIRSQNPLAVQEALRLHNVGLSSLEETMHDASNRKLFICPPLNGWILVIGPGLPEATVDVDYTYRFLVAVSQRIGHVQYFSLNRVASSHAWAMLEDGEVLRAYAWNRATLWNQGPTTEAEQQLKLVCLEYAETKEPLPALQAESMCANTERVQLLAARWSIDPASALARIPPQQRGFAGELPQSIHS